MHPNGKLEFQILGCKNEKMAPSESKLMGYCGKPRGLSRSVTSNGITDTAFINTVVILLEWIASMLSGLRKCEKKIALLNPLVGGELDIAILSDMRLKKWGPQPIETPCAIFMRCMAVQSGEVFEQFWFRCFAKWPRLEGWYVFYGLRCWSW